VNAVVRGLKKIERTVKKTLSKFLNMSL